MLIYINPVVRSVHTTTVPPYTSQFYRRSMSPIAYRSDFSPLPPKDRAGHTGQPLAELPRETDDKGSKREDKTRECMPPYMVREGLIKNREVNGLHVRISNVHD
jgi:hypothetical protein